MNMDQRMSGPEANPKATFKTEFERQSRGVREPCKRTARECAKALLPSQKIYTTAVNHWWKLTLADRCFLAKKLGPAEDFHYIDVHLKWATVRQTFALDLGLGDFEAQDKRKAGDVFSDYSNNEPQATHDNEHSLSSVREQVPTRESAASSVTATLETPALARPSTSPQLPEQFGCFETLGKEMENADFYSERPRSICVPPGIRLFESNNEERDSGSCPTTALFQRSVNRKTDRQRFLVPWGAREYCRRLKEVWCV
ncbi:unnamed protein product [Clonostachys rosea]|uniref:Uncharacterized protein n=1 Tax=Bionectria ochroleuca TaxID=29856 RepID=A0ABY6UCU8_BIOOC|nr:unnamed protein product [Clonostachys rosea]